MIEGGSESNIGIVVKKPRTTLGAYWNRLKLLKYRKNPCKKCLVQPCCDQYTKFCGDKKNHNEYLRYIFIPLRSTYRSTRDTFWFLIGPLALTFAIFVLLSAYLLQKGTEG